MKLEKQTIKELGIILNEEFDLKLQYSELEKLANSLVGYFGLLQKIEDRHKVRK